jgi:hypothetical protein
MKEVTPDSDVLKGSVFHRLLQRAFPEWFPYDSIRFFHPFYTGQKNAMLAKQQGYAADFRILELKKPTKNAAFDVLASNPNRPLDPVILKDVKSIKALLSDKSDKIVHPSRLNLAYLPKEIVAVLTPKQKQAAANNKQPDIQGTTLNLMQYFIDLLRGIIKRESIRMDSTKDTPVYQLDVVKE